MTAAKDYDRILLSPPHMSGREIDYVEEAFASNWVAPLGPHVDAFEEEFREVVGSSFSVALSSGTAALHLALKVLGVKRGDEVAVSTLTFAASVNAIRYLGAEPVLIDSESTSWNMDPSLLAKYLTEKAQADRAPRAVVLVHIYGQTANLGEIQTICEHHNVPLIEDAAEALGATYRGQQAGSVGTIGVFSFNGNKMITTSGGGMLVTNDQAFAEHARKLANQAREPTLHYEHREVGYNYRLSNILAGVGRAQLRVLHHRVEARRRNFQYYAKTIGTLPGIEMMPEAPWGQHCRWLTAITVDPSDFGTDKEGLRLALHKDNIETRPVWKPMHLQPVFGGHRAVWSGVAEDLFERGLCLPSGSNLTILQKERIAGAVCELHERMSGNGGNY